MHVSPTHTDYPHPSLLHAIAAVAAVHTAWVKSLAPSQMVSARDRAIKEGMNLELLEDFGSAQAESAMRSVHETVGGCNMGPGNHFFDIARALVGDILS
jgi:hypothetical protein